MLLAAAMVCTLLAACGGGTSSSSGSSSTGGDTSSAAGGGDVGGEFNPGLKNLPLVENKGDYTFSIFCDDSSATGDFAMLPRPTS